MNSKNILLLGVKGMVLAFDRASGKELWRTDLTSSSFVSLLADETKVYAHSYGELFCLDISTGEILWKDGLTGLGYGTASLAFPGGSTNSAEAAAEELREEEERRRNRNNS